jgi:hypothetical protein
MSHKNDGKAGTSYYQFEPEWKSFSDIIEAKGYDYMEAEFLLDTVELFRKGAKYTKQGKIWVLQEIQAIVKNLKKGDYEAKGVSLNIEERDFLTLKEEWFELQSIINHYNLNYNVGNILKVAFTLNSGRHSGTSKIRDLNKAEYFAEQEISRLMAS